jgi:hypothetical protein
MKLTLDLNRKNAPKITVTILLLVLVAIASFTVGVSLTYPIAQKKGYETALNDISELLKQKGIELQWQDLGNGKYAIQLLANGKLEYQTVVEMHLLVQQFRNGELVSETFHAMTVTNFGKDWVEQQLFSDVNYTTNALYLSASNEETAVNVAWTVLPVEITTNGLGRAVGAYTSTGVGACNVTKTFSISGTQSSCLYGINAGTYASYPNSLIAAEQQGAGNRKNMINGDTLALTVQWSHS